MTEIETQAPDDLSELREALTFIAEGRGRFSRDNDQFAQNVIEDAKQKATEALGILDRIAAARQPVADPDTPRVDYIEELLPAMGANVLIHRGEKKRVTLECSFGEREMVRRGTGKTVREAVDDALKRREAKRSSTPKPTPTGRGASSEAK